MNRATPQMRDFARHLIAMEAMEAKSSPTNPSVAFAVLVKVRPHLAQVAGELGVNAVLSRAVALTNAQVYLQPVGSFISLEDLEAKAGPKAIAEGRVVLLAEFLGLLTELIGERLTLQFVRQALPNCPETFQILQR